jgi:hypothetical protein
LSTESPAKKILAGEFDELKEDDDEDEAFYLLQEEEDMLLSRDQSRTEAAGHRDSKMLRDEVTPFQ